MTDFNDLMIAEGIGEAKKQLQPVDQPARLQDALLSFSSLLSLKLPKREMLYPFMPKGSLNMLYGGRGVGKTFFNIALTASLVTGKKLFRWEPPLPTGVLYIDGEMDLKELRERVTALLRFLVISSGIEEKP